MLELIINEEGDEVIGILEWPCEGWWINYGEDGEEKKYQVKQLGMCEFFHVHGSSVAIMG